MIARRIPAKAGELLELIHAINPTGRSLGAADERRRYELKARLQSLLIRNFAEELVVADDAPGVVSIRHRYLNQDACHARIDDLDDDARARVRWMLDVGEVVEPRGGTAMPPADSPVADADPLDPGRRALAEFDYETAQAHFERALQESNGDPAAARALLELLVDHMAADGDALALEGQLGPRAAADAEVRALLAVAAARMGDAAMASRLLDGLAGPRAAEAWKALAEEAIRRQAVDQFEHSIARLTEAEPTHPDLVPLREQAQRLRADARRPAELELAQLAEAGDDEATEARARALLARWPDSRIAGRILGGIQDRRRTSEAERLLAGARSALSNGDTGLATELCRQARHVGADPADLLDQIREVEAARERTRQDAEVAAVGAQLAGADPRPGLESFLALDPELRQRVRSQRDLVGELLGELPYAEAALPWLAPGGRELVVASAEGPHLFLGCVAVDDGRLRERRYLRAPGPLGELISATVDGDALWLIGDAGRVLQVSRTTGEPVRWLSLDPFLISGERIERGFVASGGKHLWLAVSLPGGLPLDRVIEIEPGRLRRELPEARSFQPLVAGSASGVIGTGLDGGAVRYTERGTVVEEIAAGARMRVSAVVIDPDRELVVVGSRLNGTGEIEIVRTRAGRTIHRRTLVATDSDTAHRCVSARDLGLLAIHHHVEQDDVEQDDVEQDDVEQDRIEPRDVQLAVFRFADPELVPVYATPAPRDLALAQDADAAQVVCLWDSSRGVEIERLGSQPPAFGDAIGLRARRFAPSLDRHFSCGTAAADAGDTALLFAANRAAERGDWNEVRTLLEGVPPDSVPPEWLAHHCHLLGIAWLRTGAEPARVRELWQLGWSREPAVDRLFKCRLDVCLEIVEPLPDPLPDAWWGPGASLIRQLRGAIASADRLTAAGQPRAALEVMRRRAVTRIEELQGAARLAAAWLAVDPHGTSDRFSAAIALARFVRLAAHRTLDLPIEGAWSRDQLTSLAERAEQWLAAWQA